jgi:hypothetical protein
MKSILYRYSFLFVLLFVLCSWGEKAHQKINSSSVDFLPRELSQLKAWRDVLKAHGSDADFRKKDDKNEFVKHFIDIDNYDDFKAKRRIEPDFEKACQKYGRARVIKEGTLPWATDSTYRKLVHDFKSGDWNRAALTAADLGHYIGDGFMPLHITANYDGQLSSQKGIHRRYEETMIDRYIDQIQFKSSGCTKVDDVHSFIFNYLYANQSYVGILLQADAQAFVQAGQQYNEAYYASLWDKTSLFTGKLLEESSKTLARLIYTAWLEAGKPKIPGSKR